MPGDKRLMSLGVTELLFTGVLGVTSVVAFGFYIFLNLGFPVNLPLGFPMDLCSLYSFLTHLSPILNLNQVSALHLKKISSLYEDLDLELDLEL